MLVASNYPTGWNAVHSELKINFQRTDLNILSVINLNYQPTKIVITIPITTFNFSNKYVYLNSGPYVGTYLIESQSNISSATWLFAEGVQLGNSSGGYIISEDYCPNYHIDIMIYKGNGDYITTLSPGTFTDGTAEQDLSGVLSKNINQFPISELSGVSGALDIFEEFYIKYRERWTGYNGTHTTGTKFFGVNAVFQDGIVNDGTLNNYAPNIADDYTITKGKFLQEFTLPVWNTNEDFILQFIYEGGLLIYFPLTLNINYLDINKDTISSYSSAIAEAAAGGICGVSLNTLAIPSDCKFIEAYIDAGEDSSRCLQYGCVVEGCVDNTYTLPEPTKVIDSIFIQLDCSSRNRTALRWLNNIGGLSQWCFSNAYSLNNENKDNKYIMGNDGTKTSNIFVTTNNHKRYITVGAEQLTFDQWEQLSKINITQVYYNGIWQNVAIEHANDDVSVDGMYSRELTIMLNPSRSHKF